MKEELLYCFIWFFQSSIRDLEGREKRFRIFQIYTLVCYFYSSGYYQSAIFFFFKLGELVTHYCMYTVHFCQKVIKCICY